MSTREELKEIDRQKQIEIEASTKLNAENDRLKQKLAEKERQLKEAEQQKQAEVEEKKNSGSDSQWVLGFC